MGSALRLAFVAPGDSIHTRRWLEHFASQGHEVALVSYGTLTEPIEGVDLLLELPTLSHGGARLARYVRFVMAAFRTRTAVRRFGPDIVHGHFVTGPGWLAVAVGRRPLIVSAWGSDILVDSRRRYVGVLNRFVLRRSTCVLCDSSELMSEVRRMAPGVRIERAMWGVDVDLFSPGEPSESREKGDALFTVLPIRGLRPLQQPTMIIESFARLRGAGIEAELLLKLGPSDTGVPESVMRLVEELKIDDAVRVVQHLRHERLVDLYREADVCLSVPTSDGTSVALLEAMASSAALIVSDIPANREWIADGENGLVIPSGDSNALADAMLRLALNRDEGARLGRAARETAVKRAAEGPSLHAAELIYQSVIAASG